MHAAMMMTIFYEYHLISVDPLMNLVTSCHPRSA